MPTFSVTLPIAGHAFLEIEAPDAEVAIQKALEEVTMDHIQILEAIEQFNQGNVCYCPHPWEAEAEQVDDWNSAPDRGNPVISIETYWLVVPLVGLAFLLPWITYAGWQEIKRRRNRN